jgi:hypothetical protein
VKRKLVFVSGYTRRDELLDLIMDVIAGIEEYQDALRRRTDEDQAVRICSEVLTVEKMKFAVSRL